LVHKKEAKEVMFQFQGSNLLLAVKLISMSKIAMAIIAKLKMIK